MDINSFVIGYKKGRASGGGIELNLAYGDTAPEDTSKLWVKADKPSRVSVAAPVHLSFVGAVAPVGTVTSANPHACSTKVGSKIYIGGCLQRATCLDVETREWTLIANDPAGSAGDGVGVCSVGNKVYFIGGSGESSATIRVLDTETGAWTNLGEKLGTQLYGMACEAAGTKIYLFGGRASSLTSAIYRFDTETGEVVKLSTTISKAAFLIGSAVVGTKIYLFGGKTSTSSTHYGLSTAYCFDTTTETLTTIRSLPMSPSSGIGCCEKDGKIYLFGGYVTNGYTQKRDIYSYDVDANTYTALPFELPYVWYDMACEAVGDGFYLIAGMNNIIYSSSYLTSTRVGYVTTDPQVAEGALLFCNKADGTELKIVNNDSCTIVVPVEGAYKGNANGIGERVTVAYYKSGWKTV